MDVDYYWSYCNSGFGVANRSTMFEAEFKVIILATPDAILDNLHEASWKDLGWLWKTASRERVEFVSQLSRRAIQVGRRSRFNAR